MYFIFGHTKLSSTFAGMTCRIWKQILPAIKTELFQVLFGIGQIWLYERSTSYWIANYWIYSKYIANYKHLLN